MVKPKKMTSAFFSNKLITIHWKISKLKNSFLRFTVSSFSFFWLNISTLTNSNEGLTLEMSAFESLYGGQFSLSTQLIKRQIILLYFPPTQHHTFFRNVHPFAEENRRGDIRGTTNLIWTPINWDYRQNSRKQSSKMSSVGGHLREVVAFKSLAHNETKCL